MLLSHIYVGVSDFDRAFAFYSGVMDSLGFVLRFSQPEKSWAGWMESGAARPLFLIGRPYDGNPANPGNGQMAALLAPNRNGVDYYGAYFRDPDGNKICVCCHSPGPGGAP